MSEEARKLPGAVVELLKAAAANPTDVTIALPIVDAMQDGQMWDVEGLSLLADSGPPWQPQLFSIIAGHFKAILGDAEWDKYSQLRAMLATQRIQDMIRAKQDEEHQSRELVAPHLLDLYNCHPSEVSWVEFRGPFTEPIPTHLIECWNCVRYGRGMERYETERVELREELARFAVHEPFVVEPWTASARSAGLTEAFFRKWHVLSGQCRRCRYVSVCVMERPPATRMSRSAFYDPHWSEEAFSS
jgi:hypothetical protein